MIDLYNEFILSKESYCEPATIIYYKENVTKFMNYCNSQGVNSVDQINKRLIINYVSFLRSNPNLKNVSIKTYMRAVKVFVKWLNDENYIQEDCVSKIKLPRNDSSMVFPLTKQEVLLIDNCFDFSVLGIRNYCVFHLMIDCGLRLSEVINLNKADISKGQIKINNSKFNKSRIVLLPDFLYNSILNYLNIAPECSGLFHSKNGGRITVSCIKKIFTNLKQRSGLKRLHAHLCRHTFATSYMLSSGNMEMLRLLMGHADYGITQNYLHLANQQKLIRNDVYELDSIFIQNYTK